MDAVPDRIVALPARKRIALVAHDHEKATLLDWARENRDILARVSGVNNGITLRGDVVGATTLTGRGAGGDATASAVIGDIVDAIAALPPAALALCAPYRRERLI